MQIAKSMGELYRYRELVRYLVVTDLKVRYRGSVLGFLWTLLNPLLLTLVLWAVFSQVLGRLNEKNYALFLLSGMMVWTFFNSAIEQGQKSIVGNRGLLQKIYLPKLVFPFTVVASNLVNLCFFLIAYWIIALFTPVGIVATAPLIVPVVGMLFILSAGGALLMSTLNVFFRDFTHLTGVLLRALFYFTPVIYPAEMLGKKAGMLLQLNPAYYPVVAARDVLYYGRVPPVDVWALGYGVALMVFMLGALVFVSQEQKFIYHA